MGGKSMWLITQYRPVSMFSLRTTYSTSSGGKTLLVPTPYAVKLAFIDGAYRLEGESLAGEVFALIKDKKIRFRPPQYASINHTFIKIQREPKNKEEQHFIPTIAFREYCFFKGILEIAVECNTNEGISLLESLA